MTQKEDIRQWLLEGPLCSTTILNNHYPRGAARIRELKQEGMQIDKRRCTRPFHYHTDYLIEAGQGRLL